MKISIKLFIIIITASVAFLHATNVKAQIPPVGKYNNTNYPEDRAAIAILQRAESSIQHLNDDTPSHRDFSLSPKISLHLIFLSQQRLGPCRTLRKI